MSSIVDTIADIQRRGNLSKERVIALRRYCCRSIGLCICLYCLLQLIFVIYLIVKITFRLIFLSKNIFTLLWLFSTVGSIYLTRKFRSKDIWRFTLPLLIQSFFILGRIRTNERQTVRYSIRVMSKNRVYLDFNRQFD